MSHPYEKEQRDTDNRYGFAYDNYDADVDELLDDDEINALADTFGMNRYMVAYGIMED